MNGELSIPPAYYRSRLNPEEQRAYRDMVGSLLRGESRVRLSLPFGSESIGVVTRAVHQDHPELFFPDFWHTRWSGNRMGVEMDFRFLESPEDIPRLRREMESAAERILHDLPRTDERAKLYYELGTALRSSVKYTKGDLRRHTALGALVDGEAVCEGIAKAYLLLCQRLNLPCALMGGYLSEGAHAWNLVELGDGKRYFVDITNRCSLFRRKDFYIEPSRLQKEGYTLDAGV